MVYWSLDDDSMKMDCLKVSIPCYSCRDYCCSYDNDCNEESDGDDDRDESIAWRGKKEAMIQDDMSTLS